MTLNSNDNLLDTTLSQDNLNLAWKRVRANKGAAGIDGITVKDFVEHFKKVGNDIVETIRHGRYLPLPVRRVYIRKSDGGQRGLGLFGISLSLTLRAAELFKCCSCTLVPRFLIV